jgi:methylmalonyl-CoA mutase, N-terminal domain
VEALTNAVEEKAREYLDKIGEMGGSGRAIEYMQEEIHRAAYAFQKDVESGEQVVVGVNRFTDDRPRQEIEQPDFGGLERGQVERLQKIKAERDDSEVRARIEAIREAARGSENLMPRLIDAVKARVSLGEISDAMRAEWGVYRPG